MADDRISFQVPQSISREHASTVALASATATLTLFSNSCLALNRFQDKGTSILICGGSSSVGLYTIQLASIYGLDIVTTCSLKNATLVRSYGAKHVFDYNDPQVVEKIHEVAPNLKHIFDTIRNLTSSTTACGAFCRGGENLCTVRPGKANTEDVAAGTYATDVLVWTAFLKDHSYDEFKWPASKEDYELSRELFEKLPAWLDNGTVKASNPKVLTGLDAVPEGFQEHRDGNISAYKIVYKL